MDKSFLSIAKDVFIPVLVAAAPIAPWIYAKLTEPDFHFIYQAEYEPNPVTELSRQMSGYFQQVRAATPPPTQPGPMNTQPDPVSMIESFIPSLVIGMGRRASDGSRVRVFNVSAQELKNIRVHFIGCDGFESFETYPDNPGSANNPAQGAKLQGQVTIRYDKLRSFNGRAESYADITFYGQSAAKCAPTVEADLSDGRTASGKKVSIEEFRSEENWSSYNREKGIEIAFKLLISAVLVYLYVQVRKLRQKSAPSCATFFL